MVEVEEINVSAPTARQKYFGWLLSIFFKPLKTMQTIGSEERQTWLLPLLLLTILTIASALVAGPLRQQAAQNAVFVPPDSFQWMSPEQQQQYMEAQQSGNGPAMTVIFPMIGALLGLWFGWLLSGSILHLVLTLFGSRSNNTLAYNLAAWSALPFALRLIVQIIAMLFTKALISSPGLSGFVAADAGQALLFARVLLRLIDLYLIWQIILLSLGAAATSGLSRKKAFGGVMVSMLLLVILSALPGFLIAQFSGLNVTRPFMFF
jgi:hypothetical protein